MNRVANIFIIIFIGLALETALAKPKSPPPASPVNSDILWASSARSLADPKGSSKAAGSPAKLVGEPGPKQLAAVKAGKCKPNPSISWVPPKTGTKRWVEAFFNTTAAAAPATISQIANLTLLLLNLGTTKPTIAALDLYVVEPVFLNDTIVGNASSSISSPSVSSSPASAAATAAGGSVYFLPIYRSATVLTGVPTPACPGYTAYNVSLHGSAPGVPWWQQAGVLGVRVTVGEGGSGAAGLPAVAAVGLGLKAPWRVSMLGA